MVVVLVQMMSARTPSAAAGAIFVVDTLAFMVLIVADGVKKTQFLSVTLRHRMDGRQGGKVEKPPLKTAFYYAIWAAAQ
jgi:hypothetical protein